MTETFKRDGAGNAYRETRAGVRVRFPKGVIRADIFEIARKAARRGKLTSTHQAELSRLLDELEMSSTGKDWV